MQHGIVKIWRKSIIVKRQFPGRNDLTVTAYHTAPFGILDKVARLCLAPPGPNDLKGATAFTPSIMSLWDVRREGTPQKRINNQLRMSLPYVTRSGLRLVGNEYTLTMHNGEDAESHRGCQARTQSLRTPAVFDQLPSRYKRCRATISIDRLARLSPIDGAVSSSPSILCMRALSKLSPKSPVPGMSQVTGDSLLDFGTFSWANVAGARATSTFEANIVNIQFCRHGAYKPFPLKVYVVIILLFHRGSMSTSISLCVGSPRSGRRARLSEQMVARESVMDATVVVEADAMTLGSGRSRRYVVKN